VASLGPFQGPPLQRFRIIRPVKAAKQVVLDHGLDHIIREGLAEADRVTGFANTPRPRFENAYDRSVTLHRQSVALFGGEGNDFVGEPNHRRRTPGHRPLRRSSLMTQTATPKKNAITVQNMNVSMLIIALALSALRMKPAS
jgi:hypothetical protein